MRPSPNWIQVYPGNPKKLNLIKKISVISLTCLATSVFGQTFDVSVSAGTGKTYIFESTDEAVNVNYSVPLSLMTELKFTPKEKAWGIKLRLHQLESSVTGENWESDAPLNGYITSLTTSLLLENEVQKGKSSYGFSVGMGTTKETIQEQQFLDDKSSTSYASISFGGHFSYRLSKDFDFQIQPILILQDPFKSIGVLAGNRKANFAGEDLSAVINFGIRYRLCKKD